MKVPPNIQSSTMPLWLGTPLRVPHYSWRNWSIARDTTVEFEQLRTLSENAYQEEWLPTDASRHEDIAVAAQRAALGDANACLNVAVAQVRSQLVIGPTKLVDIGAGDGGTIQAILNELLPEQKQALTVTLVVPAKEALQNAKETLDSELDWNSIHGHYVLLGNDLQLPDIITPASQDFAVAVASLHHHADILPALRAVWQILKPGGFLAIGDWHNSVWEHPQRVLDLLESLDWPEKSIDLARFREAYPVANFPAGNLEPDEETANNQICAFWREYAQIATSRSERFRILEGHRPARRYIDDLEAVGFEIVSPARVRLAQNPYPLLPGSSLLCITVGRRPER